MLVEVFWTTAYCAMPHKIIMKVMHLSALMPNLPWGSTLFAISVRMKLLHLELVSGCCSHDCFVFAQLCLGFCSGFQTGRF